MGKRTTTTASPNPSHDAAEAAQPHHHPHHHLFQHRHHHKAEPAPPPVAAAPDRFQCFSSDVNDCADAFIKRFRQQLELQRMQSMEEYHQMLARGL